MQKRCYHVALGSLACGLACAAGSPELSWVAAATPLALLASLRAARLGRLCALLVLAAEIAGTSPPEKIWIANPKAATRSAATVSLPAV